MADLFPEVELSEAQAEAIARGLEASHRLAELLDREDAARAVVESREAAARPLVSLLAGYAVVLLPEVPEELEALVQDAVALCPTHAITITPSS